MVFYKLEQNIDLSPIQKLAAATKSNKKLSKNPRFLALNLQKYFFLFLYVKYFSTMCTKKDANLSNLLKYIT